MKWVRRLLVCLSSVVLLVSLLGLALSVIGQQSLAQPTKVENWLNQSNLYGNMETTVVNKAETSVQNNVSGGAAISKAVIQRAVSSVFPESLLKQDFQIFLNSNYAWLKGQTALPTFNINLSGAKQEFATTIAETAVLGHLTGLSTCTASQTLQLASANPLLLSCLPAGVNPQVAALQVSQQVVNGSGFLTHPVITANDVSTKGLSGGQPYYKKLSTLPKYYQLAQKLPWILSAVSLVSILGIIVCARTKRRGIRMVAVLLVINGALLIAAKFITTVAFNKLKDHALRNIDNNQIQQSLTNFVHYIETEAVKIDLWFGIAYTLLAVLLLGILLFTRNRTSQPRAVDADKATGAAKTITPADNIYGTDPPKQRPNLNSVSPNAQTAHPDLKKRPRRPPPGLIQ